MSNSDSIKILHIEGEGEYIEKKSRFIANCYPVTSEEEVSSYIEQIKKKYYDARHHCYAYSYGLTQPVMRYADDGEPQGTAGKPMLEIINSSEVHNILIIVTRYFGGVKLGTGGLLRAYQAAAKAGLENSEVVTVYNGIEMNVTTDYQDIGKLQYLFANEEIDVKEITYEADITAHLLIPNSNIDHVEKLLTEATNGKAIIDKGRKISFYKSNDKYTIL